MLAVSFDSLGPRWGFHGGLIYQAPHKVITAFPAPVYKLQRSAPSGGPQPLARVQGLVRAAWAGFQSPSPPQPGLLCSEQPAQLCMVSLAPRWFQCTLQLGISGRGGC